MTYKNKFVVVIFCTLFALIAGCKGFIEQPSFVSVISPEEKNVVLKQTDLNADGDVTLSFDGKVSKLNVYAANEKDSQIACSVEKIKAEDSEDSPKSVFKVHPLTNFKIGEEFKIIGSAECGKNTVLEFSLPLKGVNSNPAQLEFCEFQLGTTTKPTYIKFRVTKAGNLFGLYLYSSGESKKDYAFPACDVVENEIIVLHRHLPTENPELATDEIDSADTCNASFAFKSARDFWHKIKRFTPAKTNVLLLKSSKDGKVISVLATASTKDSDWKKEPIKLAATQAENVWLPDCAIENAIQIEKAGTVYVLHKKADGKKSNADWELVPTKSKKAKRVAKARGVAKKK